MVQSYDSLTGLLESTLNKNVKTNTKTTLGMYSDILYNFDNLFGHGILLFLATDSHIGWSP